ncbi:MAG TPA: NRDE family protein [Syntrophomonas sp.]|nr:NRDE family protein [Syntrophomonas sp.]
MCLIIFAYDCHPKYRLVVAANRDEFYQRPTQPAAFWPEHEGLLAGRDVKEGGTWMGVTTGGRFATLTNYRDPASFNPSARSRGHLVYNYLAGEAKPLEYIASMISQADLFNGFNLLLGDQESLYCYSNRDHVLRKVESGIHGLSNSVLDDPWPKLAKGKHTLAGIMADKVLDVERLFTMMADREQPSDEMLPQTGVSLEMERVLAPAFVISPQYGTRTTTVLLIDRAGQVQFRERSFAVGQTDKWNEVHYEFETDYRGQSPKITRQD